MPGLVGSFMKGTRLPDGENPKNAGEYSYMPYSLWYHKPSFFLGEGEWHIIAPDGKIGAIGRITNEHQAAHTVEIHDDGSITCSPSLVMPSGWHGYLVKGEWILCVG